MPTKISADNLKQIWARRLKNFIAVIGIVFIICLYVGFHSYVTKSLFVVSLDEVLSTLISEGWKFVSTPTIFIAGLIFLLLWHFKSNIEGVFPALKEITAGGVSAKFDFSKSGFTDISPLLHSSKSRIDSEKDQESEKNDDSEKLIRQRIIKRFSVSTCKLFLSIDNQILSVDDWTRRMDELNILQDDFYSTDSKKRDLFYYGAFITLWTFVIPYLLSFTASQDQLHAHTTLKPGVKEEIQAQLETREKSTTADKVKV